VTFIQISDRFWLKHVVYVAERYPWNMARFEHFTDDILIDLDAKTMRRLRERISLDSNSEVPEALQDGRLLFQCNRDSPDLILDPITFGERPYRLPSQYGIVVGKRYFVFEDYGKICSTDLIEASSIKSISNLESYLLHSNRLQRVDQSNSFVIFTEIEEVPLLLFQFLRDHSIIADSICESLPPALDPSYWPSMNIGKIAWLYTVDVNGIDFKAWWLFSFDSSYHLESADRLILSKNFSDSYFEVRDGDSGEIVAKHPLTFPHPNGVVLDTVLLNSGCIVYCKIGHPESVLIDAIEPGKIVMSNSGPSRLHWIYRPEKRLYCVSRDENAFTIGNMPGTIEFRNRDTNAVVATWKGKSLFGDSRPLGFIKDAEILVATDNEQRFLKIDMNNGRAIETIDPYQSWHVLIAILILSSFAWLILHAISCEHLRIPRLLYATIPLVILWMLMSIRLASIGCPDFAERISYQTMNSIACLIPIAVAIELWPASMSKLWALLVFVLSLGSEAILIHKLQQGSVGPVGDLWLLFVICGSLVIMGLLFRFLHQLIGSLRRFKSWRFELMPALFWITVAAIAFTVLKMVLKMNRVFDIEHWSEHARSFLYSMLGMSLWYLLSRSSYGFLHKLLFSALWIAFVTLLLTCVCLPYLDPIIYPLQIAEELFYSCCATLPISILCFAYFVPIPRWLTRFSKQRLAVRGSYSVVGSPGIKPGAALQIGRWKVRGSHSVVGSPGVKPGAAP
jgi:hypothetical protein